MNLFIVHDYGLEAAPYLYGIRFSGQSGADKYFSYYSKALGNIRDKELDPVQRYWKLTAQGLKIMQDVQFEVDQLVEKRSGYSSTAVQTLSVKPIIPTMQKRIPSQAIINIPMAHKFQEMYTEQLPSDVAEIKTKVEPVDIVPVMLQPQVSEVDLSVIGSGLKLPPYQYQRELIKFCLDTETTMLVSPCGSGRVMPYTVNLTEDCV